jgi:hypothetical protein
MTSSVAFPTSDDYRSQLNKSDTSLVSRHTTAIEVCNLVYGHTDPISWETLSRFYEADAGTLSFLDLLEFSYLYAPDSVSLYISISSRP